MQVQPAGGRVWRRLRLHAPELVGGVGVLVIADRFGLGSGQPPWLLPGLLVVAAAIAVGVYTAWPGAVSGPRLHVRTLAPMLALSVPAYASGAGAGLAVPVLLLAVADTVRHAGARSRRIAVGWALGCLAVGEAAIASGLAPTLMAPAAAHGVAALGGGVLVLVGQRLARLTRQSETAHAERDREAARQRALLEHASDVTLVISDARIAHPSPSTERVLGYTPDDLVGRRYLDLVHPEDRDAVVEFVTDLIGQPYASGLITCRLRARDGRWVPVESSCRNLLHDDLIAGVVVNSRDVSERRDLERALEHRAFHDDLTGLANRALLLDRLRQASARASRAGTRFAVLYVDLDGFKPINDSFGHPTGDAVLVAAAQRLREVVRVEDTVARLGGDEFAVLLEHEDVAPHAGMVAERLLAALREPIELEGRRLSVTASIGIALADGGQEPLDLLRNADIAMYRAKRAGQGRLAVFEDAMHTAVAQRLQLETELQRAIEHQELILHFQPIMALSDQRIVGVEALVRWLHPERGLVGAGGFVPVAEQTGQIIPIGRTVLREACRQLAIWRAELPGADHLVVSVNVSMQQLFDVDLVSEVASALESTGVPPDRLVLELTESALARDADQAREVLLALKRLGVLLAIDDFGTGYSSLSYLHRFPVDVLKIDRSFVSGDAGGHRRTALARAMVDLGRSLHLTTVAEGIEESAQLEYFRDLRCPLGQGYLLARPADARTVTAMLGDLLEGSEPAGRRDHVHAAPSSAD
jgi:diguanylate cyclase (GGDEF)-like protein/PAS domain S-box-containing protein